MLCAKKTFMEKMFLKLINETNSLMLEGKLFQRVVPL